MQDARYAIVAWAIHLESERRYCVYSEGPNRYANLNKRGILPYVGDCSSTIRNYYNWAGASDPYRLGYADPEGYTGTELAAGTHIPLLIKNAQGVERVDVLPGDPVVYGPGTGWHTALVVEVVGENILTISMGQQGDPSYVWVNRPTCPSRGFSYDGREPQTFLRFPTATRRVYWPAGLSAGPTPLQTLHAGLRPVQGPQLEEVRRAGHPLHIWDGAWFVPEGMGIALSGRRWAPRGVLAGAGK